MYIEIISPDHIIFDGEVKNVRIPGRKGSFQILSDHAPIVSTLEKGLISITALDGSVINYMADGGVIESRKNKIILLVEKIIEG